MSLNGEHFFHTLWVSHISICGPTFISATTVKGGNALDKSSKCTKRHHFIDDADTKLQFYFIFATDKIFWTTKSKKRGSGNKIMFTATTSSEGLNVFIFFFQNGRFIEFEIADGIFREMRDITPILQST